KYVLQFRGRHLWNPSNFAISLLVVAAPASVAVLSQQWGNDLATNAVIWCFGLLIASRVRMLHVTLAYVACFVALAGMRSMITGPRAAVSLGRGRRVVRAAGAVGEAGTRLAGDFPVGALASLYPAPPILALAIVGPLAKAIDLYRETAPRKPVTESISTP